MLVTAILSTLVLVSFGLLIWQFVVALGFPLHQRITDNSFAPPITLLKPLKGSNDHTADCFRSWMTQGYRGEVQILFGVAEEGDPACRIVRDLLRQFPSVDAELVITGVPIGPNAKVSTLVKLARRAKHEVICVSDADVFVPTDFLANAAFPLRDPSVGLVNSFYQLGNPVTLAMRWEAIAVNADFWGQVLQSNSLKPQDFALGAVMLTRRKQLERMGGFESLLDYLADDYQLGRKITKTGARIALSPVVVRCLDKPTTFGEVWNHQLRWARTIRVCQPVPYFFSILNNVTLWALLLALFGALGKFPPDSMVYDDRAPDWIAVMELFPRSIAGYIAGAVIVFRAFVAAALAIRLTQNKGILGYWWLTPLKDLLQIAIWLGAFLGNTVKWRGNRFHLARDGKLLRAE